MLLLVNLNYDKYNFEENLLIFTSVCMEGRKNGLCNCCCGGVSDCGIQKCHSELNSNNSGIHFNKHKNNRKTRQRS